MHTTVLGGLSCQVQELFVSDNCWQSPQTTLVLLCWIIRNLCSRSFELILKYVWVDIAQWHGYTVTDICWEKYHQLLTKTVSSLGQTGGRRGGEFEKYFQFRHSSPTVASSDAPTALNYKTCWFSNKVRIFNSVEPLIYLVLRVEGRINISTGFVTGDWKPLMMKVCGEGGGVGRCDFRSIRGGA